MVTHGLSVRTARSIAAQLLAERRDQRLRWKRATILDKLQMDLFKWVWKRERPVFSTFFLNSTAHFQHLYWRHMEPERFKVQPTPSEREVYKDAILFGYQEMDALVGEFVALAGDATLVISTAFSQQPFLDYEDVGGKTAYRPIDFKRFGADLGLAPARPSPVMAHQFHLDFATQAQAVEAAGKLAALEYQGQPAMAVERTGPRIFGGCRVYSQVPEDAVLTVAGSDRRLPFYGLFYRLDLLKSGMHHPDGMCWIRTPDLVHAVHPGKEPLVNLAPTLCRLLDIEPPATMIGRPFVEALAGRRGSR
jgi:hypothetical protein